MVIPNNRLAFVIVMLLNIIFHVACQPSITTTIAGECILPCWEGITPGVTSAAEAKEAIEEKQYMVEETTEEYSVYNSLEWDAENYHGSISFQEDSVVSCITVYFDGEQMIIGDVVDQVGEPKTVEVEYPEQKEQICGIGLQYEEQGIVVYAYSAKPENFGVIERSQHIAALELCPSGFVGFNPEATIIRWRGFGVKHCDY